MTIIRVNAKFFKIALSFRKPRTVMEKQTLKFDCLINMAIFSKQLTTGYLMNTNNFTLTGKFSETDVDLAISKYKAAVIDTTDKVFSYESLL